MHAILAVLMRSFITQIDQWQNNIGHVIAVKKSTYTAPGGMSVIQMDRV